MPKFLEDKLKKEYGAKSKVPYKVMNALGLMRGSKETPKGEAWQKKHEADQSAKNRKPEMKRRRPAAPTAHISFSEYDWRKQKGAK